MKANTLNDAPSAKETAEVPIGVIEQLLHVPLSVNPEVMLKMKYLLRSPSCTTYKVARTPELAALFIKSRKNRVPRSAPSRVSYPLVSLILRVPAEPNVVLSNFNTPEPGSLFAVFVEYV